MNPVSEPYSGPVQVRIEEAMEQSMAEGRWDSIVLFTSDGLPLARCGAGPHDEERLLEFTHAMNTGLQTLDDSGSILEISLRAEKILVFRFFEGLGDRIILAAVVSGRKGYKRAIGKLIRLIQSL